LQPLDQGVRSLSQLRKSNDTQDVRGTYSRAVGNSSDHPAELRARPWFHIFDVPPSLRLGAAGEYNDVEAWPAERMNRHDSVRSDLQGQIAETLATARIQPVPWPWEFLDDRSSPAGRHPCRESGLYLSRGSGCPAYSQGQTSSRRQQMKFGTTFGRFDRNP
jgi:hypothetical protein